MTFLLLRRNHIGSLGFAIPSGAILIGGLTISMGGAILTIGATT